MLLVPPCCRPIALIFSVAVALALASLACAAVLGIDDVRELDGDASLDAARDASVADSTASPPTTCENAPGVLAGAAWPMALGCPSRQGRSAPMSLADASQDASRPLALEPTFAAAKPSGAVIDDVDTIYVAGSGGRVYAVDASGTVTWTYDAGAACSTPALGAGGRVYVASGGRLHAIDRGARVWVAELGASALGSPVIGPSGAVSIATSNDQIWSFSTDGQLVVGFPLTLPGRATADLAADGRGDIFAADVSGTLRRYSAAGDLVWEKTAASIVTPVRRGDVVYGATADALVALAASDARERWRLPVAGASAPSIGPAGELYFASEDGFLNALGADGDAGAPLLRWKLQIGHVSPASIDAAGRVFVVDSQGRLRVLLSTGDELYKVTLPTTSTAPLALGRRLVCAGLGPSGLLVVRP